MIKSLFINMQCRLVLIVNAQKKCTMPFAIHIHIYIY